MKPSASLALLAWAPLACGGGASPGAPAKVVEAPSIAGDGHGGGIGGRIPPEKIQAIVHASFDEMLKCYEAGLRPSPNLQMRVTIKFVIDLGGQVTSAIDAGSELPDPRVVQCVADEFKKLRFPKPDGGTLTVVYPILFNPGD